MLRSPEGICVREGHQEGDGRPFDDDRGRVRREGSIGDGGRGGARGAQPATRAHCHCEGKGAFLGIGVAARDAVAAIGGYDDGARCTAAIVPG